MIAGIYRSRPLEAPRGTSTRPTSDRLRETLFNVLAPRIEGARFADLYAGSGAVGIEAISRYHELKPEAARLFRSAAQLPGTAFSRDAAAALFATDADATGRMLDGLVAENMLQMAGPDRYRYHDLLRRYALDA